MMLLAGPLSVGAAGADFEAGVRALREQNYTAALHEFQSLAATGVANAEFMVGVMYGNGYGGEVDVEAVPIGIAVPPNGACLCTI